MPGGETLMSLWNGLVWLLTPIEQPAWGALRDFWLAKIFDERFLVAWFLPLVPVLLLVPRERLRAAILLASCVFIGYVFGVAFLAFWLLAGVGLFYLGEVFARESKRTDVLWFGPPVAAIAIIVGVYLGTLLIRFAMLPPGLNAWLLEHAPYVFPLGARNLPWEPTFAPFALLAKRFGTPPLLTAMFFDAHSIGTAYLLMRMLPYFSELRKDAIPRERRTLLNFLTYISYGPAVIQGPLERFNVFQDEIDTCHQRRRWANLPPALDRILLGVAKSVVAQVYIRPAMFYYMSVPSGDGVRVQYLEHPENVASLWLYLGMFVPILWLYLEMSGYVDVSAGIARLLGYRQIENFNKPWLSTSLRDLWRRWHISLSFILRDYIYIPLGGNRRHGTLNLCITFFLCGIWHPTLVTAGAWGIVMGLMIAVNQRWVDWMKRVDAAPTGAFAALRRAVLRVPLLPQLIAWIVTQHAFVWSLLIFSGGVAAITVPMEMARRLAAWLGGVH